MLPEKYRTILELMYEENAAVDTETRIKFWESKIGSYGISHNPTDEQRLGILELSWLAEHYPNDFHLINSK